MAYHGELVRMENGRWARFQECAIYKDGQRRAGELPLLVAVELNDQLQQLLDREDEALYTDHEPPVRLEAVADGRVSFSFGTSR